MTALYSRRMKFLEESRFDNDTLSRLRDLEKKILEAKKADLARQTDLGSSCGQAESLLQANIKLQDEAAGYSEECLKIIKSSQDKGGKSSNTQPSVKAYNILEQSADYQVCCLNIGVLILVMNELFTRDPQSMD